MSMAITLRPARPVTDDELLTLSERNPGYQFERTSGGELIVTPTGGESGRRSLRLAQQLGNWTDRDGTGVAFDSSTGFRLPDGAVHAPDTSWVRRDRWEALSRDQRRKFAPLCPDAVFEIRSESQSPAELRAKMRVYLANGARLAVLIDPDERIIEIYRPGHEPETQRDPATLALDPELPGFVVDLEPIFAE
jgi:Uma2 family endonuclease